MKKQKVSFDFTLFDSLSELSDPDRNLMKEALKARENAYAPYSKFKVGAAVLLENNQIVIGNNQENASYPSGLCAERVAIFQAGAKYPGIKISTIAIAAFSDERENGPPAAPCGNCRQSIHEYEHGQKAPIAIFMMGNNGQIFKCDSLNDLLPLAFGSEYLKK